MNEMKIESWLKDTIPGIIFLGALGSIFAILLVRIFQYVLREFFPKLYETFRKYLLRIIFKRGFVSGAVHGYLDEKRKKEGDIAGYFIHYSFTMARLLLDSIVMLGVILIAVVRSSAESFQPFFGLLGLSVAFFLAFLDFMSSYATLYFLHRQFIAPTIRRASGSSEKHHLDYQMKRASENVEKKGRTKK